MSDDGTDPGERGHDGEPPGPAGDAADASADGSREGPLGPLRARAAPVADGVRDRLAGRPRWQQDAAVILSALVAMYVLFYGFAVVQQLEVNGAINLLRRLTFLMAAYAVLVLALNLQWGYAGLFNIGVAGFMAIGVFTLAIVSGTGAVGFGLPIWLGIVVGTVAAGVAGAIAALPALRLRADYFAIVTLGLSEIVRLITKSEWLQRHTIFGDTIGLQGPATVDVPSAQSYVYEAFTDTGTPPPRGEPTAFGDVAFEIGNAIGAEPFAVMQLGYTAVLVVAVVLSYVLLSRIAYSPFGRILKAIREDEDAARALGKDTARAKIYVFAIGCALMGLGGILWQASRGTVGSNQFMPLLTFYVFVALIIGGSGSNAGSILGAIAFVGLLLQGPRQLESVITQRVSVPNTNTLYQGATAIGEGDLMPLAGYLIGNISLLQRLLMGVVLILIVLYRPSGLLGHRKEVASPIDLSRPGGEADE